MAELKEYKCPNCGGAIHFDPSLQKLKCPYCDTEFDVSVLKSYDDDLKTAAQKDELNWETSGRQWQDESGAKMRSYVCDSCGGEIVTDETTAATSCPFCGNPVVLKGQVSGDFMPDLIIPFRVSKDEAKENLRGYYKGKPFIPKSFKSENQIEKVQGIYEPFWLFDATSEGQALFNATRVRTWSDSRYRYTETKYYSVLREGGVAFKRIPVDGSKKMPDDLMESIEPYDLADEKNFQTAYMAGYAASRYDVTVEESTERANARIKTSTERALQSTVQGYSSVYLKDSRVSTHDGVVRYAMYPVWVLNTKWRDGKYTFGVNGQTGKIVGNIPVDKVKVVLKYILAMIISSAACFLACLLWLYFGTDDYEYYGSFWDSYDFALYIAGSCVAGAIIAVFIILHMMKKHKPVQMAQGAADYVVDGSLRVTNSRDTFLYSNVTKVRINNNDDHHHGGGGGAMDMGIDAIGGIIGGLSHGGHGPGGPGGPGGPHGRR